MSEAPKVPPVLVLAVTTLNTVGIVWLAFVHRKLHINTSSASVLLFMRFETAAESQTFSTFLTTLTFNIFQFSLLHKLRLWSRLGNGVKVSATAQRPTICLVLLAVKKYV